MRTRIVSIAALALLVTASAAQQGVTTLVSVHSSGALSDNHSYQAAISADGNTVAFYSFATNLVPGDTNGVADVFVHDLQTGATTRVSVDSSGVQGNGACQDFAISGDGRYVVFDSDATNLVANDANGVRDVFLHDRQTGTTERVSINAAGIEGNQFSGNGVSVSNDGRFVAFSSGATNLVPGDTNGTSDVFIRDRTLSTTILASVDSAGAQGGLWSYYPSLSGNGRVCAFQSASSFDPADTNGFDDVYVRDLTTGITSIASASSTGAIGDSYSGLPAVSGNGRFVAFESRATTLVPNDTNQQYDIFVRDLQSGTTTRVNVGASGAQATGGAQGFSSMSRRPAISVDGRYVAYESGAINLAPGDTNGMPDAFLCDRFAHTTTRVSVSNSGTQITNTNAGVATVSADGRRVVFFTQFPLDSNDTNGIVDIYLREITCFPPATYCEAGLSTNFCSPAMSASGVPSASATSGFTLTCSGLDAQKTALIFYGASGRLAQPWGPVGGSLMCVAHPVQRMTTSNSGGTLGWCDGSVSIDWLAFLATHANAIGNPLAAGAIFDAQCWYRDPPSPKSTNLSNAIEFDLCP